MLTRTEAMEQILAAKQQKGLTFAQIAQAVGRSKEWEIFALPQVVTLQDFSPVLAIWDSVRKNDGIY